MKIEDFIRSLTDSGLMTAGEVEAFIDCLPLEGRPVTGEQLAQELYRSGKLTKFQAQAIHQGKTRGLVVGNYVVLDRLGKGGMGQVYKATHKRMKRTVALKVLPSAAMRSPESVKRFQREVEAAAKLSHPNIVTAYDADEAKGVHFLVMECVDGQDLSSLVKTQGPLPLEKALDYVLQAAKGLAYAHTQGIIHRDIKPANLLLEQSGVVKVLDMGLARIEHAASAADSADEDGLTRSGEVMGTFDYMSPEQGLDTKTADLRADIYSLGCTLYVLLVGRAVYRGDTMFKKMLAHRDAPIPSIGEARSGVPESLDAVFRRMVAKRPEDRQQSMSEVIADLQNCLVDVQKDARQRVPSPKAYEETRTYHAEPHADTQPPPPPPPPPPLSPFDELFAEQPVNITQRLLAPSRRTAFGWRARQKWIIAAAVFGAAVLTVFVGAMIAMRTGTESSGSVGKSGQTNPKSATKGPSGETDVDRKAAQWVLAKGGTLGVLIDGQGREVKSIAELPKESFKVLDVGVAGNDSVTDAGLEHLATLTELRTLLLDNTQVRGPGLKSLEGMKSLGRLYIAMTPLTDEGLEHLKGLTGLGFLYLNGTQVTDAGVAHLRALTGLQLLNLRLTKVTGQGLENLKGLKQLHLGGTQVNDDGLKRLAELANLESLELWSTPITDTGLAHLSGSTKLQSLTLNGAPVTDAGLEHLKGLQNLTELFLGQTKVTTAGVARLQAALPKCKITVNADVQAELDKLKPPSPAAGAAEADREAALWILGKGGTLGVVVDGEIRGIRSLSDLPKNKDEVIQCDLPGNASVTDEVFEHLKGLKALLRLNLAGTRVTGRGLQRLQSSGCLRALFLDDTQVSDAALQELKGFTALEQLFLAGTQVTDAGLEHLGGLVTLKMLWLDRTRVSGPGLQHLHGLKSLEALSLAMNPLTDMGLEHVKEIKSLRDLLLGSEQLTDAGLVHLKGLTNLRLLRPRGPQITDAGLEPLQALPLEHLDVGWTKVTSRGVAKFKGLTFLDISGEQLNDELTTLTRLESLRLVDPRPTERGLGQLARLPNLKTLYLTWSPVTDKELEQPPL